MRPLKRRKHWTRLYVIQCVAAPHRITFGESTDVARQLRRLRTACPVDLRLIWEGLSTTFGHVLLTHAFEPWREYGQWYRNDPAVRAFFAACKADGHVLTPALVEHLPAHFDQRADMLATYAAQFAELPRSAQRRLQRWADCR